MGISVKQKLPILDGIEEEYLLDLEEAVEEEENERCSEHEEEDDEFDDDGDEYYESQPRSEGNPLFKA